MTTEKRIFWVGSSLDDLRDYPDDIRQQAGYQLHRLQYGLDPDDWKPFKQVGEGVREIRIRDESGIFRVMYVTRFPEGIYVLHCFQKKSRKTANSDISVAKARYRAVIAQRR